MFNEILDGYKDNKYIYIIEGCYSIYVSTKPLSFNQEPCEQCGSYDSVIISGYVKDIKEAIDLEDYYNRKEKSQKVKQKMLKKYNGKQ